MSFVADDAETIWRRLEELKAERAAVLKGAPDVAEVCSACGGAGWFWATGTLTAQGCVKCGGRGKIGLDVSGAVRA